MSAKRNRDKSDRATNKEAAIARALDQLAGRVRSLRLAVLSEPDTAASPAAAPAQPPSPTEQADALSAELDAIDHELARRGRKSSGRVGRLLIIVGLLALLVAPFYAGLWLAVQELTAEDTRARLFWSLCQKETTAEERIQAFLGLAALGHTEWRSARLQGLDLTGVDLRGAELHGADLKRSKISRAVLSEANLGYSDLSATNLAGSKLIATDLTETFLNEANLDKADLSRARLAGAYMRRIQATGARFNDAVLTRARLNDARLVGVDFRAARLDEANLERANLTGANLNRADLGAASLSGTILTDANWWRAVGLKPDTTNRLIKQFAPSSNAASERVKDYTLWLGERAADKNQR